MKTIFQNKPSVFLGIFLFLLGLSCTVLAQDSLFQVKLQHNISELQNLYCWSEEDFYRGEFSISDNVDFEKECENLNLFSELQYNVKSYYVFFNQLPLRDKQNLIRYFSYSKTFFEEQLEEAGLPTELKYFAPALSVMNPTALTNKRAGIWQLTHFQGVLNGLQINSLQDERFNEEKSTEAFVGQIKKNTLLFETTELAVLAYLSGNTKLKNTIARSGNKIGLNEILIQLPIDVQETIAAYQAMAVFLQNNTFKSEEIRSPIGFVSVNQQVHFQQIHKVLKISPEELQFLNPQFYHSIIPGDKNSTVLAIPIEKYDEFILKVNEVYHAYDSTFFQLVEHKIEYPPAPNRQYVGEKVKDLEIEGKTKIKYKLKSGDVLGFIAEDYDVRVADLKYWNNIHNERKIQAGKTLDIFVDDDKAEYYISLQKGTQVQTTKAAAPVSIVIPENARRVEHTVKSGESPYVIAKKYDGVSPEAILEWNGIRDARKIQIGQKLIIYLAQ